MRSRRPSSSSGRITRNTARRNMPTCKGCGKEFIDKGHHGWPQIYCDRACRINSGNKRHYWRKNRTKTCICCGREFVRIKGETHVKFCSDECCMRQSKFNQSKNAVRLLHQKLKAAVRRERKQGVRLRNCAVCGLVFELRHHAVWLCSDECRRLIKRSRQRARERADRDIKTKQLLQLKHEWRDCEWCGKSLGLTSVVKKYCSNRCRCARRSFVRKMERFYKDIFSTH
jgi:predicted nucleic acid-binding Zn ribbon protein